MNFRLIEDLDSKGNELTKEQVDFFADSEVRDNHNNLLVLYHGTNKSGIKEFIPNIKSSSLIWFTPDQWYAGVHADKRNNKESTIYQVYLNITHLLELGNIDERIMIGKYSSNVEKLAQKLDVDPQVLIDLVGKNPYFIYEITNAPGFPKLLKDAGFDGVHALEGASESYGVINSNQIKLVTNKKPTNSNNISESVEDININDAKNYFGTTNNIEDAGYILPNGELLDFSDGEEGRHLPHQAIALVDNDFHQRYDDFKTELDSDEGFEAPDYFVDKGAIRMNHNTYGGYDSDIAFLMFSRKGVTKQQLDIIKNKFLPTLKVHKLQTWFLDPYADDSAMWKYPYDIDAICNYIIEKSKKRGANLNESVTKWHNFLTTSSAIDVANILENCTNTTRILYDSLIHTYFIDKTGNNIHMDMSRQAYKDGMLFDQQPIIDALGDWVNYWDYGVNGIFFGDLDDETIKILEDNGIETEEPWLYCLVFVPENQNLNNYLNYGDGYDHIYKLDNGSFICTRDFELQQLIKLNNALGNPELISQV